MEKDIRKLAEKYFSGDCTHKEAWRVLEWFDTPEGETFLTEHLDDDLHRMDEFPKPEIYPQVPTFKIRNRLDRARRQGHSGPFRSGARARRGASPGMWAAAATLLLLVAASIVFYHYLVPPAGNGPGEPREKAYQAGVQQHKVLSLSDGSTVRLNSNSRLTLPEVFRGDAREVTLEGEAYFEIQPDPDKPFIVHTGQADIRVLGTAFNVKASAGSQKVQVAVREGKVAFRKKEDTRSGEVLLTRNQVGSLESGGGPISVERVRIDNYLSWMTRRLVFDNTPLPAVCGQLESIYELNCSIGDTALTELHLTADFERESLRKTLRVIARSLDIGYRMTEDRVMWIKK